MGIGFANVATAIASGTVTVGTTVGVVIPARPGRKNVTVIQEGFVDVRLGDSTVTTSAGALLVGTKGTGIVIDGSAAVYGISTGAAQAVSYLETF